MLSILPSSCSLSVFRLVLVCCWSYLILSLSLYAVIACYILVIFIFNCLLFSCVSLTKQSSHFILHSLSLSLVYSWFGVDLNWYYLFHTVLFLLVTFLSYSFLSVCFSHLYLLQNKALIKNFILSLFGLAHCFSVLFAENGSFYFALILSFLLW